MSTLEDVLHSVVTIALDDNGWSLLCPVMDDGSLGQQIDSTDIADAIVKYLILITGEAKLH